MIRALSLLTVAALVACGETEAEAEPECDDGAQQCDGDVVQYCVEGLWEDTQDCAADGLMCHAELGHCMSTRTGM